MFKEEWCEPIPTANTHARPSTHQPGVALALALVLLLILSLLAVAGMSLANSELIMAGNEQFRQNAVQAASAGIEHAIASIGKLSGTSSNTTVSMGPVSIGPTGTDTFSTHIRHAGTEFGLPQSSADKFAGVHFVIESQGISARNARDTQIQGVMVVTATGAGGGDFRPVGGGLAP